MLEVNSWWSISSRIRTDCQYFGLIITDNNTEEVRLSRTFTTIFRIFMLFSQNLSFWQVSIGGRCVTGHFFEESSKARHIGTTDRVADFAD